MKLLTNHRGVALYIGAGTLFLLLITGYLILAHFRPEIAAEINSNLAGLASAT